MTPRQIDREAACLAAALYELRRIRPLPVRANLERAAEHTQTVRDFRLLMEERGLLESLGVADLQVGGEP